jgi:hypothetical protein
LCSSFAAAKTQTIRRASLARSCLLSRIKNHHSDKKKECARRPLESENPSKSSWWTDELMNPSSYRCLRHQNLMEWHIVFGARERAIWWASERWSER